LRISSAAARVHSLAEGQIAAGERKCEPTPKPLNKFLARVASLFYVCSCNAVPAEVAEPIVDLLNRRVSVAGISARNAEGNTESPGNGAATAWKD
jgi:hypothetical protein